MRRLVAAGGLLLFFSMRGGAQPSPSLVRESAPVQSYDGRTMAAEAIRLEVPERRGTPGRTRTQAALRIPTRAERPGNPVVFLMGGPGVPGTVMARVPPYFTLFQRLSERSDVILVDQRGLGGSVPAVDCPFAEPLPRDAFLGRDRIVSAIREQVEACAAQLRRDGIDPTAYTSIESADDLEDLRKALGVERIDLLAFSYGARLALVYVQRHGNRVGRMVLQGVNGPGLVVKRPAAMARKLERVSALLARDASWTGPTDLGAAARAARERLARTPATVTVADRKSGQPIELTVGRDGLDAIVGLNADDGRLPALLVSVAAGDDRVLARYVEGAWNGLQAGTVGLMARAVNCAADRPASRWEVARREASAAPFAMPLDNEFLTDEFCRAVGYEQPVVEFAGPVTSDVPALLLTGTLDATTPVENAEEVARGLEHAILMDVEHAGHEALPVPAVQDVVVDFLHGEAVAGRRLSATPPRFASVEEALAPPPPRGR